MPGFSLLKRLKQRKLLQWGLAYLAGAWVLLQVFDLVAESFAWPESVMRAATVFLAISFLTALVLAWYHGEQGRQRAGAVEIALLAGIVAIAAAGAAVAARSASTASTAAALPAAPPEQNSIAVLPFVNMSDSPENEYFSDGMTEEILNALAKVDGLRVASRTSAFQFKNKQSDIREVARQLRVASVLEGSVRKAGDQLRITAQLIDAENGYHLWSETYDRELKAVFAVQEEIARAIVAALRVELAAADRATPLVRRGTDDLEAYTLYLRANELVNRFSRADINRALELYHEAIARDPNFAAAYAAAASAWMLLADDWLPPHDAYPKARKLAERAVALDSTDAVALEALGSVIYVYDWRLEEGARLFDRAIARNPNSDLVYSTRGLHEELMNRFEQAEQYYRRSLLYDPLSAWNQSLLARLYLHQRRWDEAARIGEELIESNPRHLLAHRILGDAHLGGGRPQDALRTYRKGLAIEPTFARLRAAEVRALAALGHAAEARQKQEAFAHAAAQGYIRAEEIAQGWAALGETDRAFDWLDRALEERSAGLLFLNAWPAYEPLRTDPRFAQLLARVGLPAR